LLSARCRFFRRRSRRLGQTGRYWRSCSRGFLGFRKRRAAIWRTGAVSTNQHRTPCSPRRQVDLKSLERSPVPCRLPQGLSGRNRWTGSTPTPSWSRLDHRLPVIGTEQGAQAASLTQQHRGPPTRCWVRPRPTHLCWSGAGDRGIPQGSKAASMGFQGIDPGSEAVCEAGCSTRTGEQGACSSHASSRTSQCGIRRLPGPVDHRRDGCQDFNIYRRYILDDPGAMKLRPCRLGPVILKIVASAWYNTGQHTQHSTIPRTPIRDGVFKLVARQFGE